MNFSQITEVAINEGIVSQILKDGVVLWSAKKARLPKEYQEVEYIHIPSGAYIDTGFVPENFTHFYIKLQTYSDYSFGTGQNPCLAGNRDGDGFTVYNPSNSTSGIFTITTEATKSAVFEVETTTNDFECQTWIDGRTNGLVGPDAGKYWNVSFNHSMYIGAWWYSSSSIRTGVNDIYAVQANIGSTQYLDLVPCYRKADNAVGLYNLVNNQFLTNSGTGTMTVGPNV